MGRQIEHLASVYNNLQYLGLACDVVVSRSHEYARECSKAASYQYQIKLVLCTTGTAEKLLLLFHHRLIELPVFLKTPSVCLSVSLFQNDVILRRQSLVLAYC